MKLLETHPRWLEYGFLNKAHVWQYWRDQIQKWFKFRFTGNDDDITFGEGQDFYAWEWVSMKTLIPRMGSFNQPVYQDMENYFMKYCKE